MAWYPRREWLTVASSCSTKFNPDDVRGVCIHYPGGNIPPLVAAGNKAATASYLRQTRLSQLASTAYNYCDIEYNLAVDRKGNVWELRGTELRGGANGTTESNAQYVSIFVIVGLTENAKPTAEQVEGVRKAIKRVRRRYGNDAKAIRPHSDFRPTACPGAPLHKLIESGELAPVSRVRLRLQKVNAAIKELVAKLKRVRANLAERRALRDELRKKL